MGAIRHRHVGRVVLWTSLGVASWLAASLPSGFSAIQIAMFAGPGIVLAIAGSWASHAGVPGAWTWRHGLKAAATGAMSFPPFVALFFAWAGTFGPEVLVTLLVFSAWLVVLGGMMIALARLAMTPKHERRRARLLYREARRISSPTLFGTTHQ